MPAKKKRDQKSMEKALAAVHRGMNPFKASKEYNVPRSTLRKIIAKKTTIDGKPGPLPTLGAKNEEMLVNWIEGLAKRGFPITKSDLTASVEKIVLDMKITNKFVAGRPGKKWVKLFMNRHPNIALRTVEKLSKNRVTLTREALQRWFVEVETDLRSENMFSVLQCPGRVFNMDESGFQLCPKGEKVLAIKGQKNVYEHSGNDKENVTVLIGISANGVVVPPLVVYPGQRLPKGLVSYMPENDKWSFAKSEKGWITGEVFYEYIANTFHPWLLENNIVLPVILFLDGHSSHLTLHLSQFCSRVGIVVVALHPNATHVIQPLDVSVFGPLKKKWARAVHEWKLKNNEVSISKLHLPNLLDEILENQLTPQTLINGFRVCGLCPFSKEAIDYSKCGPDKHSSFQDDPVFDEKHVYVEHLIGNDLVSRFIRKDGEAIKENEALFNLWVKSSQKLPPRPSNSGEAAASCSNSNGALELPVYTPSFSSNICVATVPDEAEVSTTPISISQSLSLEEVISPNGANVPSPFKKNLFWPVSPMKKLTARRKLRLPAVVTSPKWRQFEGDRITKKKDLERLKEERKLQREKKKQEKEMEQKLKKKRLESESSNSSIEVPQLSEDEGADWDKASESDDSTESSLGLLEKHSELRIDDYVIVLYSKSHFPGRIVGVTGEGYRVSSMERSLDNWKWPSPEDVMDYQKQDVIKKIGPPKQINKRGAYEVKEMRQFSNYFI